MNEFGKWLQNEIDKKNGGWNQATLAKRAGVSRTAISDALSGKRNVGCDLAVKIAHALGISPIEVLEKAGIIPQLPNVGLWEHEMLLKLSKVPSNDREKLSRIIDTFIKD